MSEYPVSVQQKDDRHLMIVWNDGVEQVLDSVFLRKKCPCAVCIDEFSGRPKLDPSSISDSVRPTHVKSVGQYAVHLSFSDGHDTGFFSFKKLRDFLDSKEN